MFRTLMRTALVAATLAGSIVGAGAASAVADIAGYGMAVGGRDGVQMAQRYGRDDSCSPRQALRKADRIGLNRARIVRQNRRVVVVDGFKRGRLVSVRFAQDRGCPVINVR